MLYPEGHQKLQKLLMKSWVLPTRKDIIHLCIPYSAKLWRWKSLMKFDKSSMTESLTSKTLTNRWLLPMYVTMRSIKCKNLAWKTSTNQYPFVKFRQTFPPSKFCAIQYITLNPIPMELIYNNLLWGTVSKAFVKSSEIRSVCMFWSRLHESS